VPGVNLQALPRQVLTIVFSYQIVLDKPITPDWPI
jgi:hypothetical protein